ncbi:hypothetical protein ASD54_20985 [Rhizobium sp. Root149]|uniref:NAD-dependent epimerase/dehydratase family protein n=1 Tax=Rhizobium sp. Root149 TaxID=1736473 RepID=UPI0007146C46|nr:NAD-dependent epimerase/dehydratase family protein [Rhizobium sp. Root149]KQZ47340.1 hypothetical protein ASD54_20985 [Rhizobium sp. Root149]
MILVTGANGFVGRHLCDELQYRNIPFRPVTRNGANATTAIGDISRTTDWSAALQGIETVVHLAARVHVMSETEADPLAAFRALNVEATVNLARQAQAAGVRRFVFVSSVKVNGERTGLGIAFKASDPPAPEDAYGQSKAEAEVQLLKLADETGLEVIIVRPPLVYGPGVGANFRLLMRWAASGLPSPFGLCQNKRSLIYVGNLVDLLIRAAKAEMPNERVFMASDKEDLSTADLFSRLARLQGRNGFNLPVPPALLHAMAVALGKRSYSDRLLSNLQVDIGKTVESLRWSPPFEVDDALKKTVLGLPSRE